MGKWVGKLLWKDHRELSDKIEDMIRILETLMKTTGLGDFHSEIDVKKRFCKVIVKDSIECYKDKSPERGKAISSVE